ncbi:hypothetical protein GCM10007939_04260 [Amylibacter marinus]|uniref:Fe2OG dioxygenase domain-containing protein n=1 Tax=Amylibacter marinus TaxID=1475483 RepID=A0ABQ5VSE2_9RHOB|nr:2OG-Fe(II) oxygenase [Amylibacter marinus]GLQ34143.1 hypothetical protein GCM10007939_04260 [Amylibacter marinus]
MSIDLLRKLGVYIDTDFLTPTQCQNLCQEIQKSSFAEAKVYDADTKSSTKDDALRQSLFGTVSSQADKEIRKKIMGLRTDLEHHFNEQFDAIFEAPKYLAYDTGHFFGAHTDDQLGRRINISIYLNDETSQENTQNNSYCGGSLKIYGLLDNPALKDWGVSLTGAQGLLVAYRADLLHEVTPVLSGSRYAIVSRFLKPRK